MKCVICKQGETRTRTATVTLQRDETIVIIKSVPADVCDNCGEYYLSELISKNVMSKAQTAAQKGAEVEILKFAA